MFIFSLLFLNFISLVYTITDVPIPIPFAHLSVYTVKAAFKTQWALIISVHDNFIYYQLLNKAFLRSSVGAVCK